MTNDKDFVNLWSAVLETFFEDARNMGSHYDEIKDSPDEGLYQKDDETYIGTDWIFTCRHACSDHIRHVLQELGIDRKAFLKALRATRRQARSEYCQLDNLNYQKEVAIIKSII